MIKNMILQDVYGHDMPVSYHKVIEKKNNIRDETTVATIGSYRAEGQYNWKAESFFKPPFVFIMPGLDRTDEEVYEFIKTQEGWEDAT